MQQASETMQQVLQLFPREHQSGHLWYMQHRDAADEGETTKHGKLSTGMYLLHALPPEANKSDI